jgi:hypothetical protein
MLKSSPIMFAHPSDEAAIAATSVMTKERRARILATKAFNIHPPDF